ncbi:FAD/NAD(P)-binding protein [Enterococcus sp. BWR-S5]|uniref:FAD/NAD(P)-binding protein n=1 Tax=Enterococcus sp. BWR-S5 TaxID=2787714 RepID=UPI0019236A06|nr:FAD/NAD(P)-binding protein [Enterococcus sp. BWR-S5]MBL1227371.1 FAD/NAD(P)-binding protein [Enterococcus sp. BWR-S5]
MKIVIVGGGPRGLSVLERIVERSRDEKNLKITMFDPHGPGGKIWRQDQPLSLLMNSVACQVTLFTDETLSTGGPVAKGPNLYEWAEQYAEEFIQEFEGGALAFINEARNLGPNDHCSRAFYGLYQRWFYRYIQTRMTEQTSVTFFNDTVRAVRVNQEGFLVYTKSVEITADKVILALGHQDTEGTEEEQKLAAFATEHRLFYSTPKNAADNFFDAVKPRQTVLLKGLGLAFFDYMTMLTVNRGGKFHRKAGILSYQPSGNEPKIVAGSGRGFPYHARGNNQKGYGEQYQPRFLKQKNLNKWKRKGDFPAESFFTLLKKEIEFVYYTALIKEKYPQMNHAKFSEEFIRKKGDAAVLTKYQIPSEEWWDWAAIEHPDTAMATHEGFASFVSEYVKEDCLEAGKGNVSGPVSSAFDSLKDMRDQIRFMLDHQLFTNEEYKELFLKWFVPLNAFLSIGPPLERMEELQALLEAGVVTLLAPNMRVDMGEGQFTAYSSNAPEQRFTSFFLMEARIPAVDVTRSMSPLMKQLLNEGVGRRHSLELSGEQRFFTGAIDVESSTNQLIDAQGKITKGLFCYGVPTEGIHWLTAATARPGTDPWNLREADKIAEQILADN